MPAIFYATLDMSFFGFTLAILYYSCFSERTSAIVRSPAIDRFLASNVLKFAAFPGFVILLIWAPSIAVDALENMYELLRAHDLSLDATRVVLGLWMETAIVAGWMIEYLLQRKYRNLPPLRFSF